MLTNLFRSSIAGLVVVAVLIALSIPFQRGINSERGEFRSLTQVLYLSSSTLRRVSLGYEELLADIYWLRAIQYFGGKKHAEKDPELLFHFFDIITDLDPKFVNAYRYGGTFLADIPPIGLGDIEKGVELFDKGRANNPDNYHLPLEEAFIFFMYTEDFERAAELFCEAADKPNLSAFRSASLKGMCALAHAKGGDRELSRSVWTYIYENTTNEGRKEFALRNLKELQTKDMEDMLTKALRIYVERHGVLPGSLEDLKTAKIMKKLPVEPFGGSFVITPKLMAVKSTTLAEDELYRAKDFLYMRAQKFKKFSGRLPRDLLELRSFIESSPTGQWLEHPYGEQYVYDPQTGLIEYDKVKQGNELED